MQASTISTATVLPTDVPTTSILSEVVGICVCESDEAMSVMFAVNVVDAIVTLEGIITPPLLQQSADRLRKLMIDAGLSQSGKANPRNCGRLTKGANIADAADQTSLHKSPSSI